MGDDPAGWSLERRAATTHGEIAWDVFGHGSPVVLVHGTPSRSMLWRNVVPALAERFTVYAFDLLGFGQSERSEIQKLSIRLHAQVLAELIQIWDLDSPALVGHDIGGAVVLRTHLLEETPVSRIALIDAVVLRPWITPTTRHMLAHLDVYRTMPTHIFQEVAAAHLRTATYRPMNPAVFAGYFEQWEGERGHQLWIRTFKASMSGIPLISSRYSTELPFPRASSGAYTMLGLIPASVPRSWVACPAPIGFLFQTPDTSRPRTNPPG